MSLSSAEFDPKDPVNSFASVWQRVMLEPRAFFEGLPATGGLQPPLAFAAICLAIGAFGFLTKDTRPEEIAEAGWGDS